MRRIMFGTMLLVSSFLLAQPPSNEIVSVSSSGGQGNDHSGYIFGYTADGRPIYSMTGCCSISADGRFVIFNSIATNLVPGDTNDRGDVFLFDRQSRQVTRVSVASDGTQGDSQSDAPFISADGQFIAFASKSSTLIPGAGVNRNSAVYVYNRQTGRLSIASVASDGTLGNDDSFSPVLSGDGRYVAFSSRSSNLVSGDTNAGNCSSPLFCNDIFVHDMQTGQTTRVSVDSNGAETNGISGYSSISSDGRFIVFESDAHNLVSGRILGSDNVFLHDRDVDENGVFDEMGSGKISTVLVSVDSNGQQGYGRSQYPKISGNGQYVAFVTTSVNLLGWLLPGSVAGDTEAVVKNLATGAITTFPRADPSDPHVGRYAQCKDVSISADGNFIVCKGHDSTVTVAADPYYLWVWKRPVDGAGANQLIRLPNAYDGGNPTHGIIPPNGGVAHAISGNGQFLVFDSDSTNLVSADTNGKSDVYVVANPIYTPPSPPPPISSCTENDGGNNVAQSGFVQTTSPRRTYVDECYLQPTGTWRTQNLGIFLKEFFCRGTQAMLQKYKCDRCRSGVGSGRCIPSGAPIRPR